MIELVPPEAAGVWMSHNTGYDMSQLPERFSLTELQERITAANASPVGFVHLLSKKYGESTEITRDEFFYEGVRAATPAMILTRAGTAAQIADHFEEVLKGNRQPRRLHAFDFAGWSAASYDQCCRLSCARAEAARALPRLLRRADTEGKPRLLEGPENYGRSLPSCNVQAKNLQFWKRAMSKYILAIDVGGTFTDLIDYDTTTNKVRTGKVPSTPPDFIEGMIDGIWNIDFNITINFASVDVTTIGAGGGSIAYVDDGGVLHVGPRSAGARPGPACYGQGGAEPTVTDAILVLGRLGAQIQLAGRISLRPDHAEKAIESPPPLLDRCGIDPDVSRRRAKGNVALRWNALQRSTSALGQRLQEPGRSSRIPTGLA